MKERPILFNEAMVRAVLAGTKTQTRRLVKYSPSLGEPEGWCHRAQDREHDLALFVGNYRRHCPYGAPGDRLWVRETWAHVDDHREHGGCADYRADVRNEYDAARVHGVWRPSIHMPRWASRITLEVTGVRVERLQSISEEDAKAEGVYGSDARLPAEWLRPARDLFRELWNTINEDRAPWSANPWVWVVSYKRVTP